MRTTILVIFLISNRLVFSQVVKLVDSPIKVNIKGYSHDYLTPEKKEKAWRQTAKVEFWFNSRGLLLQTRFWGKHHNTNLKLLNKITQNTYDSNNLRIFTQEWENSYSDSLEISFKTLYSYNNFNQLSKRQVFWPFADTPFISTEYTYIVGPRQNLLNTTHGTIKYFYEYDSLNRLTLRKQFFGRNYEKLNWIESYSYSKDTLIYITNVYSGDSVIQYSKKNTTVYNKEQQALINIDEYLPPKESFPYKNVFVYNKLGLIIEIKTFRKINPLDDFVFTSTIKYNYKLKTVLDVNAVKKINDTLTDFDSEE